MHLFSYCIVKLVVSGLEIGMVAWTLQCHSCRLMLSELHITASESSAEFERGWLCSLLCGFSA